jgi:hypothetical protein
MRSAAASAILSIAAFSSGSLAAYTMNIARFPGPTKLSRRNLSPRATIAEALANNVTGGSYMAPVSVGTPGQQQSLAIDTGSSDVWVLDVDADLCTNLELQLQDGGGCSTTCKCPEARLLFVASLTTLLHSQPVEFLIL